jgi:drug/metabolite transporter (DMT)-like permease
MLFQIATLAWLFLGERLTGRQLAGMAFAMAGTLIVQLCRPEPASTLKRKGG